MADEIRQALTAAEWIQYGDDLGVMADFAAGKRPFGPDRRYTMEEKRHAVAAIALHRQAFGFTHDEEAMLDMQATFYEHRAFAGDAEIAARLRALLRGRRKRSSRSCRSSYWLQEFDLVFGVYSG